MLFVGSNAPAVSDFNDTLTLCHRDNNHRDIKAKVKAIVQHEASEETIHDERITRVARAKAVVLYSSLTANITARWSVEYDGKSYDIDGVIEPWGRKLGFEIDMRCYS